MDGAGIDRMIMLLTDEQLVFVQSMEILAGSYCAMRLAVKYIRDNRESEMKIGKLYQWYSQGHIDYRNGVRIEMYPGPANEQLEKMWLSGWMDEQERSLRYIKEFSNENSNGRKGISEEVVLTITPQ